MNTYARLAIAAAGLLIVGIAGYSLLPRGGSPSGAGPAVSSPSASPAPSASPSPSATPSPIPPAGALETGERHTLVLEGVPLTFEVPTDDWISNGEFGIDKAAGVGPDGAGFIFWVTDADGIFSDPCGQVKAEPVGASAAEMAAAIASVPGTEPVSGPQEVTVGGRPAQLVVISIPDDIPCDANDFHLWYDTENLGSQRYATEPGATMRVWIVDVDGKRVQLDAETYAGAGPEPGQEIQQIIDSIQFE